MTPGPSAELGVLNIAEQVRRLIRQRAVAQASPPPPPCSWHVPFAHKGPGSQSGAGGL